MLAARIIGGVIFITDTDTSYVDPARVRLIGWFLKVAVVADAIAVLAVSWRDRM